MRKFLTALLATGLMTSSVFAWNLTNSPVKSLEQQLNGDIYLTLVRNGSDTRRLLNVSNADQKKTAIAIAMTALAGGLNVTAGISGGNIVNLTLLQQ